MYFLLVLMLLSGCGSRATAPPSEPSDAPGETAEDVVEPEPEPAPVSPLSGVPLVSPGTLVAAVVDNSSSARPQTGLSEADVVYEVLAEGGITRLLALYHSRAPEVVGPIRSTRPYFTMLAKEWNAILAHCGGSEEGLGEIKRLNVISANEMYDPTGYFRDTSRAAPHNLYMSVPGVRNRVKNELPEPTPRWELALAQGDPASSIRIRYGPEYEVKYVLEDGKYMRYVNGSPHRDKETGSQLFASTIVVQYARSRVAYAYLALDVELVGKGKAEYFIGGVPSEGTWEKASKESPTRYLDRDGKTVAFAPGQIWIQIVPLEAQVTYE